MWHPASCANEIRACPGNMYRDVGTAEEGGVDLKAEFEWKREEGGLHLWERCSGSGWTRCAIGLYVRLSGEWWR